MISYMAVKSRVSRVCGIERVSTKLPSLKLTVSHLKMDAWNTIVSFCVPAYFQGCVCFREGNCGGFLDLLHTWNLVGHLVYKQGASFWCRECLPRWSCCLLPSTIDRSPSYHRFWLMNYLRTFCRFGLCMSSLHLKKKIYIDEHIAVVWIHGISVYFSKIQYLKSLKPCYSEQHVSIMTSKKKKETHTHTHAHIFGDTFSIGLGLAVQYWCKSLHHLGKCWTSTGFGRYQLRRSGCRGQEGFRTENPPAFCWDDAVRGNKRWCWAERCF